MSFLVRTFDTALAQVQAAGLPGLAASLRPLDQALGWATRSIAPASGTTSDVPGRARAFGRWSGQASGACAPEVGRAARRAEPAATPEPEAPAAPPSAALALAPRPKVSRETLAELLGADEDSTLRMLAALGALGESGGDWMDGAKPLFEDSILDPRARLDLLERLSPGRRRALIKALSPGVRRQIVGIENPPGGTPDHIARFPWAGWDAPGTAYCPMTAWGLSTLAHAAYGSRTEGHAELREATRQALEAGGFEVRTIGEEPDPRSRSKEPRLATPFLLAARGDLAIVAIRGRQTMRSTGNIMFHRHLVPGYGGRVHHAFEVSAREVWRELEPELDAILGGLPPGKPLRVVFTGHSLGGGAAMLLAHRTLAKPGVAVSAVYTFGTPRGMDDAARAAFEAAGLADRTWRVENHRDPFPEMPPQLPPFMFGAEYVPLGRAVYCGPDGVEPDWTQADFRAAARSADPAVRALEAHRSLAYLRKLHLSKDLPLDHAPGGAAGLER